MRTRIHSLLVLSCFVAVAVARAQEAPVKTPVELFAGGLQRIVSVFDMPEGAPQTFSTRLEFVKAQGLPKELHGQSATLAVQAPDRLTPSAQVKGKACSLGRDGQDRKSTRLNSSHDQISYAVFCLKKKKQQN